MGLYIVAHGDKLSLQGITDLFYVVESVDLPLPPGISKDFV